MLGVVAIGLPATDTADAGAADAAPAGAVAEDSAAERFAVAASAAEAAVPLARRHLQELVALQ